MINFIYTNTQWYRCFTLVQTVFWFWDKKGNHEGKRTTYSLAYFSDTFCTLFCTLFVDIFEHTLFFANFLRLSFTVLKAKRVFWNLLQTNIVVNCNTPYKMPKAVLVLYISNLSFFYVLLLFFLFISSPHDMVGKFGIRSENLEERRL